MEFGLSEEQQLLQDSIARFVEREYSFENRQKLISAGGAFSQDNWQTFADMGWLMLGVPEALNGLGGSPVETAIVMEQFGKALVVEPYLAVAVLAAQTLIAAEVCDELVAQIGAGTARPVLAHSELGAFGTIGWVETQAAQTASGWKLNGHKSQVLGGKYASHFIVSARTAGADGDEDGVSLFLVQPQVSGLTQENVRVADSSWVSELTFADCELPGSARIVADAAFPALSHAYAHATVAIAAEAVGAMDKALWTTRDYLQTRTQFGAPIGSFQALQHRMADMLIELEMARSQVYRALAFLDAAPDVRDTAVSSMKVQIGRSVKFIAGQAVQLHGGMGMTEEYLIGHYFRRLYMIESAFGPTGVHLDRMAALGNRAA
jgi:alkylation response protein AidB-like acyl-CoA dehydrogenase